MKILKMRISTGPSLGKTGEEFLSIWLPNAPWRNILLQEVEAWEKEKEDMVLSPMDRMVRWEIVRAVLEY